MIDKVIVSVYLNDMDACETNQKMVPITPEEIANEAYDCWKAGASIVSFKANNEKDIRKTINILRTEKECDVIVSCPHTFSDSSIEQVNREELLNIEELEVVSYYIDTFNYNMQEVTYSHAPLLQKIPQQIFEAKKISEITMFDEGMMGICSSYIKRGFITKPFFGNFVLGSLGGMDASIQNLEFLHRKLPQNMIWSACGVGANHMEIMYGTLALGGNIKVGQGICRTFNDGTVATNVLQVERASRVIKEFGKSCATPNDVRNMMGL